MIQDLVAQVLVERRGDLDIAVVRNNMTGDALAALSITDDAMHELALPRVRAELSRPGARLRVVLADGALMSEHCTWADLVQC